MIGSIEQPDFADQLFGPIILKKYSFALVGEENKWC